jgi:hypothetical protein
MTNPPPSGNHWEPTPSTPPREGAADQVEARPIAPRATDAGSRPWDSVAHHEAAEGRTRRTTGRPRLAGLAAVLVLAGGIGGYVVTQATGDFVGPGTSTRQDPPAGFGQYDDHDQDGDFGTPPSGPGQDDEDPSQQPTGSTGSPGEDT